MSNAIRQTIHQPVAANEAVHSDAGRHHINRMRALLGKCAVAAKFDGLSDQQKAMVLYGAKLRPSSLLRTPFESMSEEEREAVRQSLIAMQEMAAAFSGMPLGRADVLPVKSKPRQVYPKPAPAPSNNHALTELAAELAGMAQEVRKQ